MNNAVSFDQSVYLRISQFLGYEALLLDENRLDDWIELLHEDIVYEVPIRLSDNRKGKNEFPKDAFRIRDDLAMLRTRVARTATGEAWAEDPPSRTLRLVGSISIELSDQANVYRTHSALLVYRQRGQEQVSDLIPARRLDLIKVTGDRCMLVRRTIILADTVLQTPNLGIFL